MQEPKLSPIRGRRPNDAAGATLQISHNAATKKPQEPTKYFCLQSRTIYQPLRALHLVAHAPGRHKISDHPSQYCHTARC
jgi:hypothetical protein